MSDQAMNYARLVDQRDQATQNRTMVRTWLAIVLLAIFALVIVGGATRLTDSGLSITEWKPINGVIPPLSVEQWDAEFDLYRQIPEYQLINKGMSMAEFKVIYWWEWAHRFLARGVGVVFGIPLLIFWAAGRIEPQLKLPLVGLLFLGGLQGFIGWWMVSSGLVDRVDVSQYRLATHLTLACIIFALIVWVMRGVTPHAPAGQPQKGAHRVAIVLTFLIVGQIFLGGLVAGLDAGLAYNTWPLMDGALVPSNLLAMEPAWRNFFESTKTVQFIHRIGAYVLWTAALYHMISCLRTDGLSLVSRRAIVLFALVTLQALFGIVTLVLAVPMSWGLIHQGMALIVLGFAVAHWRGFVGAYPMPVEIAQRD